VDDRTSHYQVSRRSVHSRCCRRGRPTAARIGVGLPVCVTDDPAAAGARAAQEFAIYGRLPSYRAMLNRKGAAGPADISLVGDEAAVRAGIEEVVEAGGTDFIASCYGSPGEIDAASRC
jgi:5,10-methylenetetrahydromethanopterin reductase